MNTNKTDNIRANPTTELKIEMIDRFGLLPDALKNLFQIAKLKLKAGPMGVQKIELGSSGGRLYFKKETAVDAGQLINLIQSSPNQYKLDGQDKLRIIQEMPDFDSRVRVLENLLDSISMRDAA